MIDKTVVIKLYEERYGYTDISRIFNVSKQRIHQIITGYSTLNNHKNKKSSNCQMCDKKSDVVHHVDKNPMNNEPNNLLSLCAECHRIVHKGGKRIFNSKFTVYLHKNKKPDNLPTCCKYHHDHPKTLKL